MPGIINDPAMAMYVAAAVALVVMTGLFVYLWRMERQVRAIQRLLESEPETPRVTTVNEPLRPQRIEKELSDGLNRR